MTKSLSSILSQIERLQKEAANIQSEVVTRIRKDIAKYGLTAEQLFGSVGVPKPGRTRAGTEPAKAAKPPKYADGTGNTWGGMGKRPEWIRQALAAGKALEDFLISNTASATPAKTKATKTRAKPKTTPLPKAIVKKRAVAKSAASRKPRAMAAADPEV
ncbi:H-NS histone family protein [Roseateles cellulosilyticus]|uniref:H-NS histone family protein n=1 Tax=Pelomonas cellulosilytica TaxID=2906762 RepID=UPI0032C21AA9